MTQYVYDFQQTNKDSIPIVGGKGANLGELSTIKGIKVSDGFCISTDGYREAFSDNVELSTLLDSLSHLQADDTEQIAAFGSQIRDIILDLQFPTDIESEIDNHLKLLGENSAYAVRSSATAEDLPTASFAGQHDSFLNIIGKESIIKNVIKCWASLFTTRAIIYRIQNNFDHRKVYLSVIVQRMVIPRASGVMFTADPITSNRNLLTINACYGLGEALVSGHASADYYSVRDGVIVEKNIPAKTMAIYPTNTGGTEERNIEDDHSNAQILTDEQIIQLESIGRQIESHYSYPQDIEWCLCDDGFIIVQSRTITTLYPLPVVESGENHVFLSSGHLQMMTAPMKPLGIYFFCSVIGNPPYQEIGGRVYLDLTSDLATPIGRLLTKKLLGIIGDSLLTNAIIKITKNKEYIRTLKKGKNKVFNTSNNSGVLSILINAIRIYRENNPDIIKGFIDDEQKSIDKMEQEIENLSGGDLFKFIYQDHEGRRTKIMQPPNAGAMTAVMLSTSRFNKKLKKWLGVENAADTIIQSLPNSVTLDTGLTLLDVADVVRRYPKVIEYFKNANDDTFFEDIARLDGGKAVCESIRDYLDLYGMRCSGDIDITVPRWSEQPTTLIPLILNNIKNFEPNYRQMKFEQGILDSERKIQEYVDLVKEKSGGKRKAKSVKRIASLIRNYIGYREYPKFSYMKRYFIYKQALRKEASKLLSAGIIKELDDIYFLYFEEFREVVKTRKLDYSIITTRKDQDAFYEKLTPQRVITSNGDVIEGQYDKSDYPQGALIGINVSSGVIEGRARVITSMEKANFEDGDILVTTFTDPSWTPIFVSIKGLVTEVGGLTTHGAVIAREYGLPAVVSIENATKLIKDGDRIRLNGDIGYVEIL